MGDWYVVRGDYVIPERSRSLRQSRSDEETYASKSEEQYSSFLEANGANPIATAQRSNAEVIVRNARKAPNFKRRDLAAEFYVSDVHFVPIGDDAVLEYDQARASASNLARASLASRACRSECNARASPVQAGRHCIGGS